MNIRDWFRRKPPPIPALPPAPIARREVPIQIKPPTRTPPVELFRPYAPPPGVLADNAVAMDEAPLPTSFLGVGWDVDFDPDGLSFPGYPTLALMANRAENRKMVETLAMEATREWIEVKGKGDGDKDDRVAELNDALKLFNVRDAFRRAAEHDGYYGMAHIFADVKRGSTDQPLMVDSKGIGQGDLKGFRNIEPYWTAPQSYTARNPLLPDSFKPDMWAVQGRLVHSSRLLTLISREVADMLKPAFNFGGLALTQMAKPAVANFLRTRQSVSDTVANFSTMVMQADLDNLLAPQLPGAGLVDRMNAFAQIRSNNGVLLCDKNREDLKNVAVPLGGLDALQAQSQEQCATVANMPLVKYLGIQPAGLNASSDGEIRTWYDWVAAWQERVIRPRLETAVQIVMLHLWGEIDPDITFNFVPLWQMDAAAKASIEKTQADTDAVLIGSGVISEEESRRRIAGDEESMYHGLKLDPEELPEPPDMGDSEGKADAGGDPARGEIGKSGV